MAQWATFLRNHDELDLSRLTDEQRRTSCASFAPKADMQLYDRGVRRRLAPMLKGDRRHIELAYSLQFTLAGHTGAALRRGDRHGRGPVPARPGRDPYADAVGATTGGGFSTARPRISYVP